VLSAAFEGVTLFNADKTAPQDDLKKTLVLGCLLELRAVLSIDQISLNTPLLF
jgi:hypothetical protein